MASIIAICTLVGADIFGSSGTAWGWRLDGAQARWAHAMERQALGELLRDIKFRLQAFVPVLAVRACDAGGRAGLLLCRVQIIKGTLAGIG